MDDKRGIFGLDINTDHPVMGFFQLKNASGRSISRIFGDIEGTAKSDSNIFAKLYQAGGTMPKLFPFPLFSESKESHSYFPNKFFLLTRLLCEVHGGHFSAPIKMSGFVQDKKVA